VARRRAFWRCRIVVRVQIVIAGLAVRVERTADLCVHIKVGVRICAQVFEIVSAWRFK
jgi:hypothetical protein